MKRLLPVALPAVALTVFTAHVGTSNAYYEGNAGPYSVRVTVRMPGVVPGLAQISVRVLEGRGVRSVTVRPIRWDAGLEGAPPADTAKATRGDPSLYGAELWLMSFGSYSVHVSVDGSDGAGTAFVPVLAVAERRLEMSSPMAIALLGAGVFLFVGALTIFGAAMRESVLPPGVAPDDTQRAKGRAATVGSGIVLAVVLWGGWQWWGAVDTQYRSGMFRPLETNATIVDQDNLPMLELTITDDAWMNREWTPLIPDHGKLMHMFVVRDGDLSSFAHVHPVSIDSNAFRVVFPPLPAGDYRVYGDIVHESGFAQTLTDTVAAPAAPADWSNAPTPERVDPDDSWTVARPFGEARSREYLLPGGQLMRWTERPQPLIVDDDVSLEFTVTEPDGSPARLEPYLGMMSHAAVTTTDGSVFVHLHPTGSISMAAQTRFAAAEGEMQRTHDGTTMTSEKPVSTVSFPFAFPRAGAYRMWVQVKLDGRVATGVFDMEVIER